MNEYEAYDDLESIEEPAEDMDESDLDERTNRFPRPQRGFKPKVPGGKGLFQPRPTTQHVTQTEFRAAMARVGAQIKAGSEATSQVATRLNTVNARIDTEAALRKKENTGIRGDLKKARESAILPLLLTQPPKLESIQFKNADGQPGTLQNVHEAKFKKADNMLPLVLLMGGMGGSGSGGGDDNSMMMLAMVMMMNSDR
jgi:hypothetical protein